jgi:hypothetical protein
MQLLAATRGAQLVESALNLAHADRLLTGT